MDLWFHPAFGRNTVRGHPLPGSQHKGTLGSWCTPSSLPSSQNTACQPPVTTLYKWVWGPWGAGIKHCHSQLPYKSHHPQAWPSSPLYYSSEPKGQPQGCGLDTWAQLAPGSQLALGPSSSSGDTLARMQSQECWERWAKSKVLPGPGAQFPADHSAGSDSFIHSFWACKLAQGLPRWAQWVKNLPANAGDRDVGSIPGSGSSPGGENGNPLQYSCLENPMDWGAWQATVHRIAKSQTWTSIHTHNSILEGLCTDHYFLC